MGAVWHTQVALILVGHVVSVYLAHIIGANTYHTRRQVIVSQLSLLFLMVALTIIGLWVLSLPLVG
jgi:Na+-driven multidrug efflux pump